MNPLDVFNSLREFSRFLTLFEERYQQQQEINAETKRAVVALQKEVANLTTRVAVLEEGRTGIDDRVRRVMTEVVSDWQRQHDERERKRLEDEIAELRRSRIAAE